MVKSLFLQKNNIRLIDGSCPYLEEAAGPIYQLNSLQILTQQKVECLTSFLLGFSYFTT